MELRPRAEKEERGGIHWTLFNALHQRVLFNTVTIARDQYKNHHHPTPLHTTTIFGRLPLGLVRVSFHSFAPFYDGDTRSIHLFRPSPTGWDLVREISLTETKSVRIFPFRIPHTKAVSAHNLPRPDPAMNGRPTVFLPNRRENASEWRTHRSNGSCHPNVSGDSSILLPPTSCVSNQTATFQSEIEF